MSFAGNVAATPATVRRYLLENYAYVDDTTLSAEELDQLLAAHATVVDTGVALGSYAQYVGDQVAEAGGLVYIGPDDDDEQADDEAPGDVE
jgi:hypothetical protein